MSHLPVYFNTGLSKDGSEIVDQTKLSVPLQRYKSAEMKLKEMLDRELAKANQPEESNLDALDFDLPEETPMYHPMVNTKPLSKAQVLDVIKKQKQKQTDDKKPVVRKSAQTDRAKRVEHDEDMDSANEVPTEGAESE
jgi:hypothetical protein